MEFITSFALYIDILVTFIFINYLTQGNVTKREFVLSLIGALVLAISVTHVRTMQAHSGYAIISLTAPMLIMALTNMISKCLPVKTVIASTIYMLMSAITSLITLAVIMVPLAALGYKIVIPSPEASAIGTIIGSLVILSTYRLIKKWYDTIIRYLLSFDKVSRKDTAKLFSNVVITYFATVFIINTLYKGSSAFITVLCAVLLVLYGVVTYRDSIGAVEAKIKVREYELQQLYVDAFKYSVSALQFTQHNIANIIQALQFALLDDNMSKETVNNIVKDVISWDAKNTLRVNARILDIPHPVIAGVLASKNTYATDKGVTLVLNADCDDSLLSANVVDVIQCMTVILDNAIEVASCAVDNTIEIDVIVKESVLNLVVTNGVSIKDGTILKEGGGKKIGLKSLREIVDKTESSSFVMSSYDEIETNSLCVVELVL